MRKFFTYLSILFFSFSFLLVMYLFQDWNIGFIENLYKFNLFTPILVNVLSITSAWLGEKGDVRRILIYLNLMMLIFFIIIYFIGLYGFQEP